VALKRGQQLAFGRSDPIEQAPGARVGDFGLRHRIERPPQIIDGAQQILGKARYRVFLRLLALALKAAADILRFGERPQQTVLGVGKFGLDQGEAFFGRARGALVRKITGIGVAEILARSLAGLPAGPVPASSFSSIMLGYPMSRPITLAV